MEKICQILVLNYETWKTAEIASPDAERGAAIPHKRRDCFGLKASQIRFAIQGQRINSFTRLSN